MCETVETPQNMLSFLNSFNLGKKNEWTHWNGSLTITLVLARIWASKSLNPAVFFGALGLTLTSGGFKDSSTWTEEEVSSRVWYGVSGPSISCSLPPSNPELMLWLLFWEEPLLSVWTTGLSLFECLGRSLLWKRCCFTTRGLRESSLGLFLLFIFFPGFGGTFNNFARFLRKNKIHVKLSF